VDINSALETTRENIKISTKELARRGAEQAMI
jgi:hypothetical protein